MRLFGPIYDRMLDWAQHRHAEWYLGGLSFAESSFFPIPPDVMLMPMALARPQRAWRLAALTTIMSVIGGVFGYVLGHWAFDVLEPWLHSAGKWETYLLAREWFDRWGVWVVFIAGFSPIPYKVFTIAAGSLSMTFIPFVIASLIGRGSRFFLVAGLIRWGGQSLEHRIKRNVELLGWLFVALLVGGFLWVRHA